MGVAFVAARMTCPCKDYERYESDGGMESTDLDDPGRSICQPRTGTCIGFLGSFHASWSILAGLVPGASEGEAEAMPFSQI